MPMKKAFFFGWCFDLDPVIEGISSIKQIFFDQSTNEFQKKKTSSTIEETMNQEERIRIALHTDRS
jgi:hypothetical protein